MIKELKIQAFSFEVPILDTLVIDVISLKEYVEITKLMMMSFLHI